MLHLNKKQVVLLIAFLLTLSLPYVVTYLLTGNGYHFNGFLVNPTDGHSYLAKMQIGRSGEWLFRLPYTSQPGDGVFLFTYYIALGHIAGLFHLPNLLIFHITRVVNAVFLFVVLNNFIKSYIKGIWSIFALGLLCFGAGLGWLGLLFGFVSPDFTIPEMYPFLSSLTNPHFPLAIGLMLIILNRSWELNLKDTLITTLISLLLLIVQPFCMVIVIGILVFSCLLVPKEDLKDKIIQLTSLMLPSMVFGFYLNMILKNNPALSSWNSQNLTPSPQIWVLLIALSPIILPAVYGMVSVIKSKEKTYYPLVIWIILVILLAYLPLNLQRRFLIGLYIPVSILGIKGMTLYVEKYKRNIGKAKNILIAAATPTNIILIALSILAVTKNNPKLVMNETLWTGIQWISKNTPSKSLVLTSPTIGLYIPAFTNDRVIYGHPYETAYAQKNLANVEAFFSKMSPEEQLRYNAKESVDYILTASEISTLPINYSSIDANVVYQNEDVKIYAVKK
jgi:hypothetical protein